MSYNALQRNVLDGKEFQSLIPFSECKKVLLGKGNTDFSIEQIANWIITHHKQAIAISKKLERKNLALTIQNVHWFLYSHFQYKADSQAQIINALSCAWKNRYKGMDCKSYSVVGGQILASLGIKFYIRKIKQKDFAPNYFSHVYLIVPINQETGTLKDGYFTIDGTLQSMNEPSFLETKDKFMSDFQHYGLAGTKSEDNDEGQLLDFLKEIDLKNVFNNISCIGGTAFDKPKVKEVIATITSYFFDIIDRYNQAIANKQWNEVHKIYVEYWAKRHALILTYVAKYQSKDWNKCSDDNFLYVIKFLDDKIWKILGLAFEKHILNYFSIPTQTNSLTFSQPANMPDTFDGIYLWGTAIPNAVTSSVHSYGTVVPKTNEIISFQVTSQLASAIDSEADSFNTTDFLNQLATIGQIIYQASNPNGNSNGNGGVIDYNNNNDAQPKTAGFGFIAGTVIVIAGIAIATTQMKDNPKSTKPKTTRKK
jgi:hypothetical protein